DPRLMKLLIERAATIRRQHYAKTADFFTESICRRLAEAHNYGQLSEALEHVEIYNHASVLRRGFATPQGRDYLLARIVDDKLPRTERMRCSVALHETGPNYHSTYKKL